MPGYISGTTKKGLRLEAIELKMLGETIEYKVHVQDSGWQTWKKNGQTAGTTGKNLRVEAIKVATNRAKYSVSYRAHVQDIGWTNWSSSNTSKSAMNYYAGTV
ncbi:hypothetical protein [Enterococcus termitis]|uniref:Clostridial hydrophobic W n=1 Tax=Enterococcus termitis TaxID=332950 RepID=A0A1E5H763_9ENTE|nr:hypothetical protein [Enterococcus termitis]OEG20764.1 hypothetical protein BCR25_02835 [Enterococcus termitis]OJG96715.1 hypothetical protein RV18_GL001921 [Enterococcus termitis]